MDLNREYFACLALRHTPRLGPKAWKPLLTHYDSAYEAVQDAVSWPLHGLTSQALADKCVSEAWRKKAEEEYKAAMGAGMDVVTWFDPRFPSVLKNLEDPPLLLYVSGDVSLFRNPGVAVVGARECTPLGLESAGRISTQLSEVGITVVSGLALGIDRQAHLAGLRNLGKSIAVLGCGLNVDYPKDNRDVRRRLEKEGLVVTEFGPGVGPRSSHFPVRNRIISGLSLGVLVAEAAHNSGSLITARLAGEQGREVFALPGPIGQPTFTGCHRLIKQGAALVENAGDIIEILRYDFARELEGVPDPDPVEVAESAVARTQLAKSMKADVGSPGPATAVKKHPRVVKREELVLNEEERRVMGLLDEMDKVHIDALGRKLGWDSSKVSTTLLMLEMHGAIQQLPGMWYLAREI